MFVLTTPNDVVRSNAQKAYDEHTTKANQRLARLYVDQLKAFGEVLTRVTGIEYIQPTDRVAAIDGLTFVLLSYNPISGRRSTELPDQSANPGRFTAGLLAYMEFSSIDPEISIVWEPVIIPVNGLIELGEILNDSQYRPISPDETVQLSIDRLMIVGEPNRPQCSNNIGDKLLETLSQFIDEQH